MAGEEGVVGVSRGDGGADVVFVSFVQGVEFCEEEGERRLGIFWGVEVGSL